MKVLFFSGFSIPFKNVYILTLIFAANTSFYQDLERIDS